MANAMSQISKYKRAFSAYIVSHINKQKVNDTYLEGWYHHINGKYETVGVVATAQVLILISESGITVDFDCLKMLQSLIYLQNEDGGWSYRSNILDSSTGPTACAIYALSLWQNAYHAQNDSINDSIGRGVKWLLSHQNENGFWGPLSNKEQNSYTYFSCVALQSLFHSLSVLESDDLKNRVQESINKCCSGLLEAYNDDDRQCGWGSQIGEAPTLFHTSFVIYSLAQVDSRNLDKHQVIKPLDQLKSALSLDNDIITIKNEYKKGNNEYIQDRNRRVNYTHSVDIYVALALLLDNDNLCDSELCKVFDYIVNCAIATNWLYEEDITSWRMFDVVHFTHAYLETIIKKEKHNMNAIDILIMIATEDEERAILKSFDWEEIDAGDNAFIYILNKDGVVFALARGYAMGELAAAQMAQKIIASYHPKVITMAGFCAGKLGKVFLGDLIIANKVCDYENGKIIGKEFVPEITNYNLDLSWLQYLQRKKDMFDFNKINVTKPKDFNVQNLELLEDISANGREDATKLKDDTKYPDWTKVIDYLKEKKFITIEKTDLVITPKGNDYLNTYKVRMGSIKEHKHSVHIGPIATGKKVIEWNQIFKFLEKTHDRKTCALDMESYSIGYLSEANHMPFLVVKGVGDFARTGKAFANRYIDYTSVASCEFIINLFTNKDFQRFWHC